jgi:hypothetical protein
MPLLEAPGSVADHPVARSLLQRAQGATQKWPEGFRGFRARARLRAGGREALGIVTVRPHGQVDVELGDPQLDEVAASALSRVSEQLTPRFFKDGDGRYPISLGADDGHPLGRLVQVWRGRGEVVSYRIDPKVRIRQEEHQRDGWRAVTLVDEYLRATPGRVLPARVQTTSWDLRQGAPAGREEVVMTFGRIGDVWMPVSRLVSGDVGPARHSVRLDLDRHRFV